MTKSVNDHPKAVHHEHASHSYERLGIFEGLADKATLLLIFVLGGLMVTGLLTATGHVTW